jgi:uncharacterized protein (TIGR04222 family)
VHAALALYLLAAGAVVLVIAARIVVMRAQHSRPGSLGRPYGHTELSILAGSRRRTVIASLAALRAAGAVDAYSWGALRSVAPPPDEATAVDRAVYAAASRGASLVSVHKDEAVSAAITAVADEMRAAGALLREPGKRFYSWVRWPTLGAILLGAIVVPVFAGEPAAAGIGVFCAAWPFLIFAVGFIEYDAGRSRLGRRTAQQATACDLGTAVALHGVRALWAADASFADRARVPDELPEEKSDAD